MLKIKKNYFIIPLVTIVVANVGSIFTRGGMAWYDTLIFPAVLPPKIAFPIAWTLIFILITIAAIMLWNKSMEEKRKKIIFGFFIANAVLNALWCVLFFGLHLGMLSLVEIVLLQLTNIAIITFSWRPSRIAAMLMIPYFLWICFATYLTYAVTVLNNL